MRPVTVKVTNTGTSAAVPMDILACPFNVGVGCIISGTPTFTVRHSYEYPPTNWFNDATIAGATKNAETSYTTPVRCIDLVVSAVGGPTDSVTMTILQGSNGG